ncbi:hypothetical protein L211DRAFT_558479 [Terfezia boudieri ATCC MYA-4762]|uniref:Uncharacterized protein n=1 Tax=Terfezia boudieri ATCC MYA-4762 TaxID=1051890 RepID=A0A3N4M175_9PEZI|nr:hypothetical protein L211DRAFT_558479 [Terfezia boudieri ATCC MYA-4762]
MVLKFFLCHCAFFHTSFPLTFHLYKYTIFGRLYSFLKYYSRALFIFHPFLDTSTRSCATRLPLYLPTPWIWHVLPLAQLRYTMFTVS